ncbi:MAG: MCE family protein [Verrucomicrobia bacterium]|nr:MCE family protein [Verrucomicrobiota bacterium]
MTDQLKNILIGLFVVAAITIVVAMILFLKPTVGDGKKTLHARFANIAGINVGTRVSFAGKPVGEVISIEEVYNAREVPTDETGRVYFYQLTLKVDSSVDIYNTDEVAIRTTGLMGEKSIAILPKAPPKGKIPKLIDSEIIYANSVDPLENTFNQMSKVATKIQTAVDNLDQWFEENRDPLTHAISSLDSTLKSVDKILTSADEQKLIPSLRESSDLLSQNLRLIRTSLDEDQMLHKAADLMANLNKAAESFNVDGAQTLKNLNLISRDIATGTGTLGRLINSDDFYLRVNSLLGKGETLMNDINHYGVLFQYDKKWQRSRTKRANLLKSLDSPKEFHNYFEGEVDTITTSLGRLTELLERAQESTERTKILQSEAFRRDFASLLRQVQSLTDSIKLYNEELVANADSVVNE